VAALAAVAAGAGQLAAGIVLPLVNAKGIAAAVAAISGEPLYAIVDAAQPTIIGGGFACIDAASGYAGIQPRLLALGAGKVSTKPSITGRPSTGRPSKYRGGKGEAGDKKVR